MKVDGLQPPLNHHRVGSRPPLATMGVVHGHPHLIFEWGVAQQNLCISLLLLLLFWF
jgi:hypothetical protein